MCLELPVMKVCRATAKPERRAINGNKEFLYMNRYRYLSLLHPLHNSKPFQFLAFASFATLGAALAITSIKHRTSQLQLPMSASSSRAFTTAATSTNSYETTPALYIPTTTTKSNNDYTLQSTVSTQSSHTYNDQSTIDTSLTVNGQPIEIPKNGSVQQELTSDSGTTTRVSSTHESSGSASDGTTSVSVSVSSVSTSSQDNQPVSRPLSPDSLIHDEEDPDLFE